MRRLLEQAKAGIQTRKFFTLASYPVLPSPSDDTTVAQVYGRLSLVTFRWVWSLGYFMSGAYFTIFNNRRRFEFPFPVHVGHSMSVWRLYFSIPSRYSYVRSLILLV